MIIKEEKKSSQERRKAYMKNYSKIYSKTERGKEVIKYNKKIYRQTEKAKLVVKAYNQSEKARSAKKLYKKTEKAKEHARAYGESPNGRLAQYRYTHSIKGRMSNANAQMKYREKHESKEKAKIRQINFRNSPAGKIWSKKYYSTDKMKEYMKIHNHIRRARKSEIGGSFTIEEEKQLRNRCNNQCVNCERTENLHLDHIIPVSKGGSSNIQNYQLLCQHCNLKKMTKLLPEYISREVADEYIETHAQRELPLDTKVEEMLRSLGFIHSLNLC